MLTVLGIGLFLCIGKPCSWVRCMDTKMKNILLLIGLCALTLFLVFISKTTSDESIDAFGFGECVGIIRIDGEIITGDTPNVPFRGGPVGSESIVKKLEQIKESNNIKAIVVVIDSPGGSVVASHEIYNALKEIDKPKVAFLHEIATSGGYYVSAGADYIIADPDSITGSIGVRAMFISMKGLLNKLGVNATTITSGAHKDMGDVLRDLDNEERAIVEQMVNEIFEEFKKVIIENRGDKIRDFDEITDGRIMTGRQALRYGLVDRTGSMDDALNKAAELANITFKKRPPICNIVVKKESKLNEFLSVFSEGIGRGVVQGLSGADEGFANEGFVISYS